LSQDNQYFAVKALLCHFGGWEPRTLLHTYLNNCKGEPVKQLTFTGSAEYDDAAGVSRIFMNCQNMMATVDRVVDKQVFREYRKTFTDGL